MFLADFFLDVRLDFSILGKALFLELRVNQLSIECDFKPAAARRDQRKRFDIHFEGFQNLIRQTDGLVFVASLSTIFNLDLHFYLLPIRLVATSRIRKPTSRFVRVRSIRRPSSLLSEYAVQDQVLQAADSYRRLTGNC